MSPQADDKDDELAPLKAIGGDAFDMNTFMQILEMDDPPDHEFSSSIVFDFFDQAEDTFSQMDTALEQSDLPTLSSLGHFLKGSSATLGMIKVRDGCEKIQQYGKGVDDDGIRGLSSSTSLERIREAVKAVKEDFADVEQAMRSYYAQFD
jgi:osomolarity two-component system phosphorelay intermediate protein YPD1